MARPYAVAPRASWAPCAALLVLGLGVLLGIGGLTDLGTGPPSPLAREGIALSQSGAVRAGPSVNADPGPVVWDQYSFESNSPDFGFSGVAAYEIDGASFIDVVGGSGECGRYCLSDWQVNLDNPSGPTWVQLGSPWGNGTLEPSLAWDAADSELVLFGGLNGTYGPLNETWTLVPFETGWVRAPAGPSPPPRWGASFTYDPALGGLLLYGGQGAGGSYLSDTWLFRDNAWTEIPTSSAPPGRAGAVMEWQEPLGRIVLTGGNSTEGPRSDTWGFSGSSWYAVTTTGSPVARTNASGATDAEGDVILFGGYGGAGEQLSDAWVLVGDNWTELPYSNASTPPGPVVGAEMVAFANAPNAFYLVGGTEGGAYTFEPSEMDLENGGSLPPPEPLVLGASAVPTNGTRELNTTFTAWGEQGSPPYEVEWDFGDGSPGSALPSLRHAYEDPGHYVATVLLQDSASPPEVASREFNLTVGSPSTSFYATFTASPEAGGEPLQVAFAPTVVGGSESLTYAWRFGDGSPTSRDEDPQHLYNASGSFAARLWVNSSSGLESNWTSTVVVGGAGLSTLLSASPSQGDIPLAVNFTASAQGGVGPYEFLWNFGDNVTETTYTGSATQTYRAPGDYTVEVTVVDARGDHATGSTIVEVERPPPFVPPPPGVLARIAAAVVAAGEFLVQPVVLVTTVLLLAAGYGYRWVRVVRPVRRAIQRGTAPIPLADRWGLAEAEAVVRGLRSRRPIGDLLADLLPLLRRDLARTLAGLRGRFGPPVVWAVRRLLLLVPQLLLAASLLFLGFEAVPTWLGHPVLGAVLPPGFPAFFSAWGAFLEGLFTFQFANPILWAYLPYSLQLLAVVVVSSALLSYPLGLLAGWRRGQPVDHATRFSSILAFGVPVFVVMILTVTLLFAWYYDATNGDILLGSVPGIPWDVQNLGGIPSWFGPLGNSEPTGFVLLDAPLHGAWSFEGVVLLKMFLQSLPIAAIYSAIFLRYARLATVEAAHEPHIVAGRARGLGDRELLWTHTSRRVAPVYVAIFGSTFPTLLFIQMVAEWLYDDDGLGAAFLNALDPIFLKNTPAAELQALSAVAFVLLLMVFAADLVGDGLSRALDPAGWSRSR